MDESWLRDRSLNGLINDALDGKLAMPEFQRGFVWRPQNVKMLVSSVAQDWPIGSFLLWSPGPSELAVRGFNKLPQPSQESVVQLVLDGQQRLTGLVHALTDGYADHVYFVRELPVLLSDQLDPNKVPDLDENLDYLRKTVFEKRYGTLEARATKGVARLSEIANDSDFTRWLDMYLPTAEGSLERHELMDARQSLFPGLLRNQYKIPCVSLPRDLDLSAVARIFETTNKTGVKLSVVDLMVAKLYPSGFNLRKRWESFEQDEDATVKPFAGDIDAEDILRVLAYMSSQGLTRERILKLDGAFVLENWDRACVALVSALEFLRESCGVIDKSMLPAQMMLLPIAVALDRSMSHKLNRKRERELRALLSRWFWWNAIRDRYRRSTNTRARQDTEALLKWINDPNEEPQFIKEARTAVSSKEAQIGEQEQLKSRLVDTKTGEAMLEATVLSLIIHQGGRDWEDGAKPLSNRPGEIESHHIFPQGASETADWGSVDSIANLTPQSQTSNKLLSNKMPGTLDLKTGLLQHHLVAPDTLIAKDHGDFMKFLNKRADMISTALFEELDLA